jgi:hypothetical protein
MSNYGMTEDLICIAKLRREINRTEQQLAEAQAKIEMMKCCGNCCFYNPLIGAQDQCEKEEKPTYGNGMCDEWEIK